LSDSFSCAKDEAAEKPVMAWSGLSAVTVGLMLKLMKDPGEAFGTRETLRLTESRRAETDLYRFSPVCGDTPSNCALLPPRTKARTAWETLVMTWAGAAGPWEKYRAPPVRPEPQA